MPRYASFLLRSWHSGRHGRVQWVGRLENLQEGQCEQFTSIDALLAHLRLLLDPDGWCGSDPPEGRERP